MAFGKVAPASEMDSEEEDTSTPGQPSEEESSSAPAGKGKGGKVAEPPIPPKAEKPKGKLATWAQSRIK